MTNRDLLKEARKVCERIEAAITSAAELIPDTIPEYIQALSHLRGACESSMAVQDWIDTALAAPEPDAMEIVRKVRETSLDGDKWLYSDDEAAALIEQYGRRVPRWISTKDNKPEYPGEYLMYDDDIGNQSICVVKWTGKVWTTINPAAFAVVVVTHWMPIPETPRYGVKIEEDGK